MKLAALVLALLAATAAGQAPVHEVDCKYYNQIEGESDGDKAGTLEQIGKCNQTCTATFPSLVEARDVTSQPIELIVGSSGFEQDKVKLVYTESLKYFSEVAGDKPEILFPACPAANYQGFIDSATFTTDSSTCKRTWTMYLKWAEIANLPCAFVRTNNVDINVPVQGSQTNTEKGIQYDVALTIRNYEYFDFSRPSTPQGSPDIRVRTLSHALPFTIQFVATAKVSTEIQAFAQLAEIAAITRQEVSVSSSFNGEAFLTLNLLTSIQNPFVIDEIRFDNSGSNDVEGISGDEDTNGLSDTLGVVNFALEDNPRNDYDLNDGPNANNVARANEALSSCDGSGIACSQLWKFRLQAVQGSKCNFNGVYRVRYSIRCRSTSANNCPINLAASGRRDINKFFTLDIKSSRHCADVIATVTLSSNLYTHPSPDLDFAGAGIDGNGYASVTGTSLPRPPYTDTAVYATSNLHAVPADWKTTANSKDDFLQDQFVFGVARTAIGEASVTSADFRELSIKHPGTTNGGFVDIITAANGFNDGAFNHNSGSYKALKFGRVADSSTVRGGGNLLNGGVSYPYFFFKIDTETLNIDADENKPVDIKGVVVVTYQNAGSISSLGAELQTVSHKFSLSTVQTANGQRFQSSINVGGSGSGGGSGAAASEATVLGLSANVAAGAALAAGLVVGVLVGVLAMTLLSRPVAPKRSESQVQLTGTAV